MKTRWGTCVLIALLFAATLLAAQGASVRNVSGEWQGMVGRQHLVVKIERAADGSFTGTLTVPDQGNVTLPVDDVSFAPTGALKLDLKRLGAVYEAQLSDDGSALVGKWPKRS